jgi:hypothetical protein
VKVKERVKGKEVESESERACDFTDASPHPHRCHPSAFFNF